MKKILRIAFVFALAGATLMYTGCSKDYSEDIDKLDMEIQSVAGSIQSLQSQVVNALSEAQKALTEAQAAAKAAANAGTAASANADAIKAANAKVAALEARVAALEAAQAKLDEIIEAKIAGKADKSEIEAAIAEIQSIVDAALAQVSGNFSVAAVEKQTATYVWAKWAPETTRDGIKRFNKLVEVFPELADIKKDDTIEMLDNIDFIVNPSSVALDDTYKFYLLGKDGKDSGVVLGNPAQGFATKAGLNIWNVEVQKPAYAEDGKTPKDVGDLALVVENADGVYAQTGFEYSVNAKIDRGSIFQLAIDKKTITTQYKGDDFEGTTIDLANKALETADDAYTWYWWTVVANYSAPVYKNCYIIEATDAAEIEEFGVSVKGTKITINNGPEAGDDDASIAFKVTAIGVNGKTDEATFTLKLKAAPIDANAELAAKQITLAAEDNFVKYDVADFGFSALEWREVFKELKNSGTFTAESKNYNITNGTLIFFGKDGKNLNVNNDTKYSDVAAFGFKLDPSEALPGTYDVTITDGEVFKGVGTLVVSNPEACPLHLAEKLCDADGVLQIVGTVVDNGKFITYKLADAIIEKDGATLVNKTFVDEDREFTDDWSWVTLDNATFRIPVQGGTWKDEIVSSANPEQKLLYTPRNFSVTYKWFGNSKNTDTFEFKAEAVSAIYDEAGEGANITIDDTKTKAYFVDDPTTMNVNEKVVDLKKVLKSGKYVAGDKKGTEFNGFYYSAATNDKSEIKNGQVNYNDPVLVSCTATIANTTNLVQNTKYVVKKDGTFVEMSLEDALSMDFITATDFAYCSAITGYKFYLNENDYRSMYSKWSNYYNPLYIKDGKNVCNNPTQLASLTGSDKAKVEKFITYAALINFEESLNGVTIITSGKSEVPYSYGIYADPTFKVDEDEFDAYATFTADKITAIETAAGQSDVTIPVTAEIKDIWGMTTKKTFNVVLKVK